MLSSLDSDRNVEVYSIDRHKRKFIVLNSKGWMYFIGTDYTEDEKANLLSFIEKKSKESYKYFVCFGLDETFVSVVQKYLGLKASYVPRLRFSFNRDNYEFDQRVNEHSIERINRSNVGTSMAFDSGIKEFWTNSDNFLSKGFGFNLMMRDEIACQIMSATVVNDEVEINIVTSENHRKKGYASILTSRFIDYCIQCGHMPKWDCLEMNMASRNLAEKMGFSCLEQYPVVFIECNK